MLKLRCRLDLGQEALGTDDCRQLRLEDLEGHLAFVLDVLGQVDRGHAALTELTLDHVAAVEGCVETGDGIGHGEQDASKAYGAASRQSLGQTLTHMAEPHSYIGGFFSSTSVASLYTLTDDWEATADPNRPD